ncbi:MAG: hypothetical protein HQK93_08355, partial [Nitrospirae bacterium]|nr:hypothetical protein [Nitrospirota bacterium]
MKKKSKKNKSSKILTFPNLLLIIIMIYPAIDFMLTIYYTTSMNFVITFIILYSSEFFLLLMAFILLLKMKMYKDKLFYYPMLLMLVFGVYSIIGYRMTGGDIFIVLKDLRYILVPLELMLFGMYLCKVNFSMTKIIKSILIFSVLIVVWGCIEEFVLSPNPFFTSVTEGDYSFFVKYLNIQDYLINIKRHDPVVGAGKQNPIGTSSGSRPFYSGIGIDHRMVSFFIEPLSCGIYLGAVLSLVFYLIILKQNIYKKYLPFIFIIVLIGMLLSQDRSATFFFGMSLLPIVLRSNRGRIIIFVLLALSLAFTGGGERGTMSDFYNPFA